MNLRVLAPLVAFVLLVPGSSAAAADEIGLSPDGVQWGDQLAPLFDGTVRWVPGDVRTASFHVRNQAADAVRLAIAVETIGAARLLDGHAVSLSARSGAGRWVHLHQVGQRFSINDAAIPAGEQTRVQVRAAFAPSSTNRSQRDSVALRFRVVPSEATADDSRGPEGAPDKDGDDPTAGLLPDTGAPAFGWLLLLAATLLGAGAAQIRSKRGGQHG
ncbi:MAG: hypothetical protein Q8Q02_06755 [Nocardioides sp.]|nr:hypothetical protein [Nocardioides sp.]